MSNWSKINNGWICNFRHGVRADFHWCTVSIKGGQDGRGHEDVEKHVGVPYLEPAVNNAPMDDQCCTWTINIHIKWKKGVCTTNAPFPFFADVSLAGPAQVAAVFTAGTPCFYSLKTLSSASSVPRRPSRSYGSCSHWYWGSWEWWWPYSCQLWYTWWWSYRAFASSHDSSTTYLSEKILLQKVQNIDNCTSSISLTTSWWPTSSWFEEPLPPSPGTSEKSKSPFRCTQKSSFFTIFLGGGRAESAGILDARFYEKQTTKEDLVKWNFFHTGGCCVPPPLVPCWDPRPPFPPCAKVRAPKPKSWLWCTPPMSNRLNLKHESTPWSHITHAVEVARNYYWIP